MKTQQRNVLTETITLLLLFSNIYVTLWVSGFHDTERRWILLVCLFGLIVAQKLAVDLVCRVQGSSEVAAREAMSRGSRILYVVCSMSVMILIGLVLRFTA
jgi:hypothetical protein